MGDAQPASPALPPGAVFTRRPPGQGQARDFTELIDRPDHRAITLVFALDNDPLMVWRRMGANPALRPGTLGGRTAWRSSKLRRPCLRRTC